MRKVHEKNFNSQEILQTKQLSTLHFQLCMCTRFHILNWGENRTSINIATATWHYLHYNFNNWFVSSKFTVIVIATCLFSYVTSARVLSCFLYLCYSWDHCTKISHLYPIFRFMIPLSVCWSLSVTQECFLSETHWEHVLQLFTAW